MYTNLINRITAQIGLDRKIPLGQGALIRLMPTRFIPLTGSGTGRRPGSRSTRACAVKMGVIVPVPESFSTVPRVAY